MEKLIDIIRNKNINLHGLHPYISTVGGREANLEKYIFPRVSRIIIQWRNVM
jgi:hypothetical protein